jgi:stress-induced morphogen
VLKRSQLEQELLTAFPDAQLSVQDLTGTEDHYELHIASDRFVGVSKLARHRLVYAALAAHMKGAIHALALHTHTQDEWAKRT